MTLADVVAQLRTAVERLDQAAVGATRAQADLTEAHRHLTTAGTGSDHKDIRDAIDDAETAAAKAGRLGNLLAKSAAAFSRYGDHIMPGSMPTLEANPDTSLPTGEEIVASTARPKSWHRRVAKKSVEEAETAGDVTGKITDAITELGPRGTTSTVQHPTAPAPTSPTAGYADSAESAAIVVAAAIALALKKFDDRKSRRRKIDD
ncbi:hypothetical protein [Micromonospora sp. NBC_01813]|uniref:hypothetical protein n=1 Tax=Micromonospora sp. NBC_01813 TaxID=2975988 RepID=UPI002DD9C9E7|nr:hypothetical protein [Micromonospora sp. NBC_01813]WSA08003.1 hypothetical protein OG958_27935 [Micromonospora sp. NBC_01813]